MFALNEIFRILETDDAKILLAVVNLVFLMFFGLVALVLHLRSRDKRADIQLWMALVLIVLGIEYVFRIHLYVAGEADRLAFVQAHTSTLFPLLLLIPSWQILKTWRRHPPFLHGVFRIGAGATVLGGAAALVTAYSTLATEPGFWLRTLRTVPPGSSLLVFGLVFWQYFRATRSQLGQWLGGSVILYGLLQFAEAFSEAAFLLFIALILKTLFAFSVVLLGMTLSDRRKIVEYFGQSSLGIGLCTRDETSGDLEIRLPNRKMRQILERKNVLQSGDFSELWGHTLSSPKDSPRRDSLDFLASFKRDSALYRFFLIPAPHYFMGTSHLLLAYELESLLGSFRDVHLGLIIAGRAASEPERNPVDQPVLWCNKSVEELLKSRQDEIVGAPIREFIHPDWHGLVPDEDARATTDNLVALAPRQPGHAGVLVRLTSSVLPAPGNPETELSLIVVTDRARATRTHTQILLRNFQHNLRNPLESLKATVKSLSHESLAHERGILTAEHLSTFQAKIARVSRVVQLNLQVGQDLAREERDTTSCDVVEVLRSIRRDYAEHRPEDLLDIIGGDPQRLTHLRAEDGHYLDLGDEPSQKPLDAMPARIDKSALETVLIELIDNALRRSHARRPKIEIRSPDDDSIELMVTNDLRPEKRWVEHCEQGRLSTTSQGLTCVRLICIRWGWSFRTSIDPGNMDRESPRFSARLVLPRSPHG